ncbi:MAG TPA: hypothetical protein VF911_14835 [Thermoanaerobaculia bacterium]|jgi:hypothetical protein
MRTITAIAALLLATSALAGNYAAPQVFIPIVTHTAGANGTQWRTDLVITNRDPHRTAIVAMIYDPIGRAPLHLTNTIDPHETLVFTDFVGTRAGLPNSFGTLTLVTDNEAPVAAHARVYNTGNAAGEFGQIVQGLPISELPRTAWLNGLIGSRGFRTNVGIANPNATDLGFSITWYDKFGESHGSAGLIVVPAYGVLLYNDIFNRVGMPHDEGLTLRITATLPVYAYASVVRNDTGDAYTIVGDGPN